MGTRSFLVWIERRFGVEQAASAWMTITMALPEAMPRKIPKKIRSMSDRLDRATSPGRGRGPVLPRGVP